MRGKLAKKMRRMAEAYVKDVEKKPLGEGYRSYKQLDNRIDWQQMTDPDGKPMYDPDGMPSMTPAQVPGTIYTEYLVRIIYHRLKRIYRDTVKGR